MGLKTWLIKKAVAGRFPLWVYRLIGKHLAKTLKMEGMKMAEETPKPWYKSKAKWAAILAALVACVQPVSTALGHPYQVPLWVIEFLTGLGIYGVRDAIKK